MSDRLIHIVPWNTEFLPALAEKLLAGDDHSGLGNTRVIFPHNRPARHLRAALAAHPLLPRPALLPRMQSLDEFMRTLRQALDPAAPLRAGKLDRIGLLHGIVSELGERSGPLAALNASARDFFPWGARLASLLEEMAGQNIRPAALHNLAGEVSPWAEALLGQLDTIAARYHEDLASRGWTTPGIDSLWLCNRLDELDAAFPGEHLIFAGLHVLNGAEEPILHRLWEQGIADFYWHTDPALATGGEVSWAAREHRRWLDKWRARPVLACPAAAQEHVPQVRRFFEGFDLHSQLFVLERELAALPDTGSTAIVLPDPGALVPVMHHLPAVETNISMGYPLGRSALAQLIETVLVLHENADARGRHAWRDLIALVRHPLLRMLRADDSEEMPLKSAYVGWERHIRASGAMQAPEEWPAAYEAKEYGPGETGPTEADVRVLHQEILTACFDNFRGIGTLRQAGQALDALCDLLRRRGGDSWRRHLLDAECLLRLWQSVVPELTGSILADEPYDKPLIFLILRHLIDAERVSFEPEPLAGMQVLGMLETRLLSFERLFILDATEDKLPGANPPDPLLPDPLRQALGLSGRRERDNVAAHNFFRLLMGAREVCVLYQAGVRPGALEGKSERSRYVEQLLWELEQRQGALVKAKPLGASGAPLQAVSFPVCPILPCQPAVSVTPAIRAKLTRRLHDKGITPSGLEVWLSCPKKAFFSHVLGLRPLQEVAEDGDRAQLGEIVHQVLRDFLTPHLGKPIHAEMLDARVLTLAFEQALAQGAFSLDLPYDARKALLEAGRERLERFLANLPATTVVALEQPVETRITLSPAEGQPLDISLHGRIDRIDLRADGHVVLDYKTGGVKSGGAEAWLDGTLFARVAEAVPGSPEAGTLLHDLAEAGLDVQLPLYLHLLAANDSFAPTNAAWIELKSNGAERPLFTDKDAPESRTLVMAEHAPALARLVLEHALRSAELPARVGRQCQWCDYKGPCQA